MNIIEKTYTLNGTLQIRKTTKRIILHHAAAVTCTVEQIDSWHKNNGWTCIGYHFVVRKDGSIYRGRPENTIGAHASNNNSDSIGICAEGNFEIENMPEVQKQSIINLIAYLNNKYGSLKILRHEDVGSTDCPGKNYPFNEIVNGSSTNSKYRVGQTVVVSSYYKQPNDNIEKAIIPSSYKKGTIAYIEEGSKNQYMIQLTDGQYWVNDGDIRETVLSTSTVINTYTYYPKCASNYTSLVDALNSIKIDSSFNNRKKIALKNYIPDYTGTANQNNKLLEKLKLGRLIRI